MPNLSEDLAKWGDGARAAAAGIAPPGVVVEESGTVVAVADGIAFVSGLQGVRLDELVMIGEIPALATDLDLERVGCVVLGPWEGITAGERVTRTGRVIDVPVGPELLGRVVDPLGVPLDAGKPITGTARLPVERPAPSIMDRAAVERPLQTGTVAIDAMVPLGRGQRELIIGDRATGKTTIAIDAIIRQRATDVICVYVAIGQKSAAVARVMQQIAKQAAADRTVIVAATADTAPGLQWLAPYAATSMAEHFAESGKDVLIVYDDLTKHAHVHRQIALLLRRPVGREAYPGDIFYAHSRLLERAAKLSPERGGGSLTALPIAETQGGNLSAFIPTNLISITDGQIVLDAKLFNAGIRPAINIGISVSRVGGKAQARPLRSVAERLRLDYAQFSELETFTRFGSDVDEATRVVLERGRRMRALLVQPPGDPRDLATEVAQVLAVSDGLVDKLPLDQVSAALAAVRKAVGTAVAPSFATLDERTALDEPTRERLRRELTPLLAVPVPVVIPAAPAPVVKPT